MRVFKTRAFTQFTRKHHIPDKDLCTLVDRLLAGAVDADLGGGVLKQRLRRKGQGKSGGFRTIVLFRRESISLFAYGFAKNERSSLDPHELTQFRRLAKEVFQYDKKDIHRLITSGALEEICLQG